MRSLEDLAVTATAQSLLANRDVTHLLQVLCAVDRDLANVSACNLQHIVRTCQRAARIAAPEW